MRHTGVSTSSILVALLLCSPLLAQTSRGYFGASIGVSHVKTADWLSLTSVTQPSIALAFYVADSHALELGWSRFDTRGESNTFFREGPSGALMRSTALRLAYQYEPGFARVGVLQPFITAGAIRARVAHRVITDVLYDSRMHSTAYGFDCAAGLNANVITHLRLVTRAGYRRTERVHTPITPTGAFADIGLAAVW